MTAATAYSTVNSLFYSAAATIIRYIFIRSSLQPQIQEVLKRDAFVFKSMFIVESLGCYNLLSFFILARGKSSSEKSFILLYQSCLDPWKSSFSTPFFKVMSLNLLLVFITAFCIIFFNIKLYTHLDKNSKTNTALSTDQVIDLVSNLNNHHTQYLKFNQFFGSDRSPRSHNLRLSGTSLFLALNLHHCISDLISNQSAISQQSVSSQSASSQ